MVSPIGTKASEEQCYMGTYHSTRGRTLSCSSKVAIRIGIAPDGGLFVSDELGTQQVDISSLADKSYFEIAQDVLGMLLNDYTAEEISACVDEAYRGTF
ncbi:MAG: threonine synthase, partial [Collinsella sp.]|nr:threonine synthase [Collinsella sp.]